MVYSFRAQLEQVIILSVDYPSTSTNTSRHKCDKAPIVQRSLKFWHSLFFSCGVSDRINQSPLVVIPGHQLQKDLRGRAQTSTTFPLSSGQRLLSVSGIRSLLHCSFLTTSYDPFLFLFQTSQHFV